MEHEEEYLAQIDEEVEATNRTATEVVEWAVQDTLATSLTPSDYRRYVLISENRRLNGEVQKCAEVVMYAIYPNPKGEDGMGK